MLFGIQLAVGFVGGFIIVALIMGHVIVAIADYQANRRATKAQQIAHHSVTVEVD
ncbi:MAG: hypothetical protein JOZ57_01095 [Abitibacteriaceae bacterium]|nr:hypothetical protein [Abditibacteriaceae bacterium]